MKRWNRGKEAEEKKNENTFSRMMAAATYKVRNSSSFSFPPSQDLSLFFSSIFFLSFIFFFRAYHGLLYGDA